MSDLDGTGVKTFAASESLTSDPVPRCDAAVVGLARRFLVEALLLQGRVAEKEGRHVRSPASAHCLRSCH